MERGSEVDNGKEDCTQKAQASKLTLVRWSRKKSLGSGNTIAQRMGVYGKVRYSGLPFARIGKKAKRRRLSPSRPGPMARGVIRGGGRERTQVEG